MLDHAVAHAQAFHVLATDVEDKLHAGQERLGAAQVRDRLDLAGVGLEGLDEQRLAVTGSGYVADGAARGNVLVKVGHDDLSRTQDVAVVVTVPGMQQLAVLAHERGLHGGRTSVDANKHTTPVAIEVALGHNLLVVAALKLVILRRRGKERLQACDLGTLRVAQGIDSIDKLRER